MIMRPRHVRGTRYFQTIVEELDCGWSLPEIGVSDNYAVGCSSRSTSDSHASGGASASYSHCRITWWSTNILDLFCNSSRAPIASLLTLLIQALVFKLFAVHRLSFTFHFLFFINKSFLHLLWFAKALWLLPYAFSIRFHQFLMMMGGVMFALRSKVWQAAVMRYHVLTYRIFLKLPKSRIVWSITYSQLTFLLVYAHFLWYLTSSCWILGVARVIPAAVCPWTSLVFMGQSIM